MDEDDYDEYDDEDSEAIENLIALPDNGEKIYSGWLKRPQEMTTTGGSSKEKPKREPKKAANALRNAGYKCEYDSSDRTFLRKRSRKPYTEPHHLIPLSRYKAFSTSVDVEENMVSTENMRRRRTMIQITLSPFMLSMKFQRPLLVVSGLLLSVCSICYRFLTASLNWRPLSS